MKRTPLLVAPIVASIFAIAIAIAPTLAIALTPEPFTAHYDVEFSGLGGKLTSTLTHEGNGRFIFENRTRARGIARFARPRDVVDRSEFKIDEQNFVPLRFESEDGTRKNKNGNIVNFDWSAGNASSSYEGSEQQFDLVNALLDRQLLQLALMRDLARGIEQTSYTVIDRHDVKTYEFEVLGTERVSVPSGEYDVVKIRKQRNGSSRATILWCAPDLAYLPVMMQQLKGDKVIATMELTGAS